MSSQTVLAKSFCQDLIRHRLFDEAVKLVKESYNLKVEANQSKNEFKIMADGVDLLELIENLLNSWLENKKKNKGNSINDGIKTAKENPVLDITKGHVVWVFWGDLGSKLLSAEIYTKVEKLTGPLADLKPDKTGKTLQIICKFEDFVDAKMKVEEIKRLVTSSQAGSDKSQKLEGKNSSQITGSKSIVSTKSKEAEIKKNDNKVSSHLETKMENVKIASSQSGSDKLQKSDIKNSSHVDGSQSTDNNSIKGSEIKENDGNNISHLKSAARSDILESVKLKESNQSTGVSGGQNVSHYLEKSNSGQDHSPHSSFSEDERNDDKLLFCTPSCGSKVFVYEASIVNMSGIDAIVNAANDRLLHGGGVAFHISKAAGGEESSLEMECREYIKKKIKLEVTKNFTSSAGKMPYKGVIHAVGPMWSEYKVKAECEEALCLTIVNVLEEASAKKFSKIALPAISSGICGVPKRVCAEMYIKGVMDYDSKVSSTQVKEIHFVDINKDILQEIKNAYGRWKQNDMSQDKKAQSTSSGLAGQIAKTVHNTGAHSDSNSSKMSTFRLNDNTCVKVYVCSIVEVKNVDAIACEVHTDFSIKRSAIAQAIRKAGGTIYEEEFNKMVKAKSGSREDVFICKTGGPLKSNKIGHVIHIKCEKFENIEDMDRLEPLFVQVFQCAKKEKLETIVMPLIGAASLKEATKYVTYEYSQLFAKTLKDAVESRGKEMNVKEIHLVDLNLKLISSISRAFQELKTANADDMKLKGEKKFEPVSRSKSDASFGKGTEQQGASLGSSETPIPAALKKVTEEDADVPGSCPSATNLSEVDQDDSDVYIECKIEVAEDILNSIKITYGQQGIDSLISDLDKLAKVDTQKDRILVFCDYKDAENVQKCVKYHYNKVKEERKMKEENKHLIHGENENLKEWLQFAYGHTSWSKNLQLEGGKLYLTGTLQMKREVEKAVHSMNYWYKEEFTLNSEEQQKADEVVAVIKSELPTIFIKQTKEIIIVLSDNRDNFERACFKVKVALGRIKITARGRRHRDPLSYGESYSGLSKNDKLDTEPY